jgi:hypothetical protein
MGETGQGWICQNSAAFLGLQMSMCGYRPYVYTTTKASKHMQLGGGVRRMLLFRAMKSAAAIEVSFRDESRYGFAHYVTLQTKYILEENACSG